jgi:SNF2 family DNA or RNA helicase
LTQFKANGEKCLVFSRSTKNLDVIEEFIRIEKIAYVRLDGTIPANKRQKLVDLFKTSPSKSVFLISTKAGSLGLNLTCANKVGMF